MFVLLVIYLAVFVHIPVILTLSHTIPCSHDLEVENLLKNIATKGEIAHNE